MKRKLKQNPKGKGFKEKLYQLIKYTMSYEIDIIAELAVLNGYDLQDEVVAVYSFDNVVKSRKMSLKESLTKLQLKLDKDSKTIGVDFKVVL